jgi:predicted nucleic acid-binding protein
MNFLLDTNVVCEPTRARPELRVLSWLESTDEDRLHISAITLGEVQRGVSRLPRGRRRDQIQRWFDEELVERFAERILPVTESVGRRWGQVMADAESAGRSMSSIDGIIAATAIEGRLTLVTRKVRDFRDSVRDILDPWTSTQ